MSQFLEFGVSLLIFVLYFLGTLGLAVLVLAGLRKLSKKPEVDPVVS